MCCEGIDLLVDNVYTRYIFQNLHEGDNSYEFLFSFVGVKSHLKSGLL